MGLFDFLKKKDTAADNKGMIGSPLKGEVVELSQVNDPTFSSGLLGSGVAVIPEDGKICAPVDGTVNLIFPTGHAVAMTTADGVELLIHFGLDTVKLEGKHFNIVGEAGKTVKKGDLLVEADVEAIKMESSITEDLHADSLDVVDLIMAIESEFDLEIPDSEVENIKTVGDIVNYIEANVAE